MSGWVLITKVVCLKKRSLCDCLNHMHTHSRKCKAMSRQSSALTSICGESASEGEKTASQGIDIYTAEIISKACTAKVQFMVSR